MGFILTRFLADTPTPQSIDEDVCKEIEIPAAVADTASEPDVTIEKKEVAESNENISVDVNEANSAVNRVPTSNGEKGRKPVKQVAAWEREVMNEMLDAFDYAEDFFYEDEDDLYFDDNPMDFISFHRPAFMKDLLPQRYSYL